MGLVKTVNAVVSVFRECTGSEWTECNELASSVSSTDAQPSNGSRKVTTSKQLVSGVDFVSIPTHDLDSSVEFYGETLGLARSVYVKERNYAEFETGNLTLSVFDFEAAGLEHKVSPNAIALHVGDVEEARSTLESRGVSFLGETLDTGVCHMALFTDPDGNALMLHHRYAPRTP